MARRPSQVLASWGEITLHFVTEKNAESLSNPTDWPPLIGPYAVYLDGSQARLTQGVSLQPAMAAGAWPASKSGSSLGELVTLSATTV